MTIRMAFAHERSRGGKDEWLTPPHILEALGPFDLDPCAPIERPWPMAKRHYTILDNGLIQPWEGRVWLNPPYGVQLARWMARMSTHRNGIALTYARVETKAFFGWVWPFADAMLFIKGRLCFYHVDGTLGDTAGAPSILIAYGPYNAERLATCGIEGAFAMGPFRLVGPKPLGQQLSF